MDKFSITTYRNFISVDKYIDKHLYKVGYSYNNKIPLYNWYRLSYLRINKKNISRRGRFFSDKQIPERYRSMSKYYSKTGYDRGHLASDASFDYSKNSLHAVYSMLNVVPMSPALNRSAWLKAERYSRVVTMTLKYSYVINLMFCVDEKYINNGVRIPTVLYKVIINKQQQFIRIFKFIQDVKKGDKLRNHLTTFEQLLIDIETYKK